jgi:hypothetical protein
MVPPNKAMQLSAVPAAADRLAVGQTNTRAARSRRSRYPGATENTQLLAQLPQDRRVGRMIPAVPRFSGHYGSWADRLWVG